MSVAKWVSEVGPDFVWLEIEDEDGAKYRYDNGAVVPKGVAPKGVKPAAKWDPYDDGTPIDKLELDDGGRPLLRQDGTGLPARIVVEGYINPSARAPAGGFGARYEYNQV
jgi:hypothetical protein